jgi:uncharacterized membrane protein YfcA
MIGFVFALGMGMVLGLLGGGGSILTVPILVYLFKVPAALATGYSLFVVGITSAIAAFRYRRQLNWRVGALFAIPSTIGVILSRRHVLQPMPDQLSLGTMVVSKDDLIMIVFGALVVLISLFMLKAKEETHGVEPKQQTLTSMIWIAMEGLVVGGITGFVGAGGGFMIVPALTLLVGISMREAIATSLLIISIKSLIGFLSDIQLSIAMDGWFLMGFTMVTVIGSFIGVQLNQNVSVALLRKAFAYVVFIVGINILIFH